VDGVEAVDGWDGGASADVEDDGGRGEGAAAAVLEVDADVSGAGMHAVVGGAAGEVGGAGAGDHGLGGGAAFVDAGSADVLTLDQGDVPSGLGECAGERATALAGADDDGVVTVTHGCTSLG